MPLIPALEWLTLKIVICMRPAWGKWLEPVSKIKFSKFVCTFNPVLGRQRQLDIYEFNADLVYIMIPRLAYFYIVGLRSTWST